MKRKNNFLTPVLLVGLLLTLSFKTSSVKNPAKHTETLKDTCGNVYKTVKIGTQIWMAENLKTTRYNDGSPIKCVTDDYEWATLETDAYCNYDNLESNANKYGRLYNWHAINTGKLAPDGWHVPTDEDWNILENFLIVSGYNFDGSKEEDKLPKSLCAKKGWKLSNEEGTPGAMCKNNNSTGFTALPGGYRSYEGIFSDLGEGGYWWTSTTERENFAYYRYMFYRFLTLNRDPLINVNGLSVRLIKDN
jgi:uncharacterized protein (TIGR02145 family)